MHLFETSLSCPNALTSWDDLSNKTGSWSFWRYSKALWFAWAEQPFVSFWISKGQWFAWCLTALELLVSCFGISDCYILKQRQSQGLLHLARTPGGRQRSCHFWGSSWTGHQLHQEELSLCFAQCHQFGSGECASASAPGLLLRDSSLKSYLSTTISVSISSLILSETNFSHVFSCRS